MVVESLLSDTNLAISVNVDILEVARVRAVYRGTVLVEGIDVPVIGLVIACKDACGAESPDFTPLFSIVRADDVAGRVVVVGYIAYIVEEDSLDAVSERLSSEIEAVLPLSWSPYSMFRVGPATASLTFSLPTATSHSVCGLLLEKKTQMKTW